MEISHESRWLYHEALLALPLGGQIKNSFRPLTAQKIFSTEQIEHHFVIDFFFSVCVYNLSNASYQNVRIEPLKKQLLWFTYCVLLHIINQIE